VERKATGNMRGGGEDIKHWPYACFFFRLCDYLSKNFHKHNFKGKNIQLNFWYLTDNLLEMLHMFIFLLTDAGFPRALKTQRCESISYLCHCIRQNPPLLFKFDFWCCWTSHLCELAIGVSSMSFAHFSIWLFFLNSL